MNVPGAIRRIAAALICSGVIAAMPAAAQTSAEAAATYSRIVAIGDVHGAFDEMTQVLRAAGVIDGDGEWSGGDTHLISLGDLLDRGPDSRAVMDLLIELQRSAPAAGGRVDVILGNHEHMNMIGDLRYVSAAEFAAFAPDETQAMRDSAFASWAADQADPATASREEFDRSYPAGYFAHRAAFAPEGAYGRWLLGLPAIVVAERTAFVHGGLPESIGAANLESINVRAREETLQFVALRAGLAARGVLSPIDGTDDFALAQQAIEGDRVDLQVDLASFLDLMRRGIGSDAGPLWYRGTVYCKPMLELPTLDAALRALGADRVVVGHTPTDNRRVQVHADGRLIMLDTGMLRSYYRGRPAALIIEHGRFSVQYADAPAATQLDLGRSEHAYGLTAAELGRALAEAEVVDIEGDLRESGMLALAVDGLRVPARFVSLRAGGGSEIAAAQLDDLIGTDSIAPTARRSVNGEPVAVQLVYPESMTEAQRLERGLPFASWCPIEPQLALMYTLDALTGNAGRNRDNILFVDDLAELVLTGFASAFATTSTLPPGLDAAQLSIPAAVVDGLRGLDEAGLTEALGDFLSRRQIRALLSRRDLLLAGR